MNKIISIIAFPFIWLWFYIYRIVWFDIIRTIIDILVNIVASPLSALWLLITFPIVIIFEIPIGLIMTLIAAIGACAEIYSGEIDLADAIKSGLSKK